MSKQCILIETSNSCDEHIKKEIRLENQYILIVDLTNFFNISRYL